jgi:hypothetical protein
MMSRPSRFFAFKTKNEYWIVDEKTIQEVPKPREMLIKLSTVEAIREYVITQNKTEQPIVDRCRDRTGWHTPEGRERIRQAKLGVKNPNKNGLEESHKENISKTMTGTRRGEFNPMYGRKHKPETIAKIRQKAYERPKRKWCVEPNGKNHLISAKEELPEGWQWGRFYDPYRPTQ